MGEEERARSDPPNEMFNGKAKQMLGRMAGDREPVTGVHGELRLDVVASRTSKTDNLEGGDQRRTTVTQALDAVSLEPLHQLRPRGVGVEGAGRPVALGDRVQGHDRGYARVLRSLGDH